MYIYVYIFFNAIYNLYSSISDCCTLLFTVVNVLQDGDVMSELPARIAEMEAQIRNLKDKNSSKYKPLFCFAIYFFNGHILLLL